MKPSKQTLLWRLSGNDLPGDSFVFGTMHVRDRRAFSMLESVYKAIVACDAFAAETDLEGLGMIGAVEAFQLPDGQALDILLPVKKYEKLRRILLKAMQVDIEPFKRFKPLVVANLLDERILVRDMPFALDQHLWQYAEEQGKRMLGIETVAEQMQTLMNIPLAYQLQALLAIGRYPAKHRQGLLKAARWYEEARIDQLYRATKSSLRGLRRQMLYDRNRRMAERIELMAGEQTTFCAIGAAHLWGEKGVLKLLKDTNIQVAPEK